MKKTFIFLLVLTAVVSVSFYVGKMILGKDLNVEKHVQETHMVFLLNNRADPDIVIINTGDHVQFNSRDGKEHSFTEGSGNAVDDNHSHKSTGIESGLFKSDEAYRVQFKKRGIYSFHDHLNPDIYIRVIVKNQQ